MLKITLCFGKMIFEFARLNLEKDWLWCFFLSNVLYFGTFVAESNCFI